MGTRKGNLESWISGAPNARGYFEAFVWMGTKPNGSPDRRRVQRKSLASVKRRVRELERDRDTGNAPAPGRLPTVREMMERHMDVTMRAAGRAPRTIDDYRSKCRNDIFPRWGGQRIDRLTAEHIEDGLEEMLAEGHAPAHVRKVFAILSSVYEVQVSRGRLPRNPCRGVTAPGVPEPARDALTDTEAQAILAAAEGRPNAARWTVGLGCGLRQGEVLGLTWDHLGLETGEMRIWRQLQRLTWQHGCKDPGACARRHCKVKPCPKKCSRHARACPPPCPPGCVEHARHCPQRMLPRGSVQVSGGLVLREIKEKRRKTFWLDDWFTAQLREHRDAQYLQRLTADAEWEEHGLVFCQWNGRPLDPRRDWQEWTAILEAAGVPYHRLHAMRHSTATIAMAEGVAMGVVKEMLGHSDIRVTDGYSQASKALLRDGSARMARVLRRPTATKNATTEPDS